MKKVLSLLAAACLLAAPPTIITTTTTGCVTTPRTVAYNTLAATQLTVDRAMQSFAVAVVNGQVSQGTQDRVRAIHGQYRNAFAAAVTAARFDLSTATPADVSALATALVSAILGGTNQ